MADDETTTDEATADQPYGDLAIINLKGGSVAAVHARTGWRSQPVPNEKAARAVFDRYVNEHPEAADAEAPDTPVVPGPLQKVSNEALLAEVDRRGLLRDAEEVPAVSDSISDQFGWINAVRGDEDAYRRRAEVILSREQERDPDDQRKTLIGELEKIVAEPDEDDESPPDGDGDDD